MTSMQEQDFLIVSEVLRDQRHFVDNDAVDTIAIALAEAFGDAYYNRFNRTQFLQDSGVTL